MTGPAGDTLRRRAYLALEGGQLGGPAGVIVEFSLIALIVGNVVAYTLQSIPEVERAYRTPLSLFELVSIITFTVEYVARLWTAPEDPAAGERGPIWGRLWYAATPLMAIDFFAVAPTFIAYFVPFLDLRILRLVRLLRLLKIARYSPALSALARVLSEERRALYGSFLLLVCAMILFAAAMHAVEGAVQPDKFGTIPKSMWWAISTLTTVGYGDVVPHTALGKFLAGAAMVVGLGLMALPVGIIATGFANSIHRRDFVVTFGMLARVPLFEGLDAKTVSEIMGRLRAYTIGSGDIISTKGQTAAAIYLVVAGELEAQLTGRKVRFTAGDAFGELSGHAEDLREAIIIAVTQGRLLELSSGDFEHLIATRPGLRDHMRQRALESAFSDKPF
jgi:voltage-gated potassium channel